MSRYKVGDEISETGSWFGVHCKHCGEHLGTLPVLHIIKKINGPLITTESGLKINHGFVCPGANARQAHNMDLENVTMCDSCKAAVEPLEKEIEKHTKALELACEELGRQSEEGSIELTVKNFHDDKPKAWREYFLKEASKDE